MSLLIETIKIKDNTLCDLDYHELRINRSLNQLWNATYSPIDFKLINESLIDLDPKRIHKLRLVYNNKQWDYTITPYNIKPINSLKLVFDDNIDYQFKYEDREHLNSLYASRQNADDILIVKNNFITDSYYCNVAFRKNESWFTPNTPLLKGTKRQKLIDEGILQLKDMHYQELHSYEKIRLFNAMIDWGEIELGTSQIFL